jgi:hypothetical protein
LDRIDSAQREFTAEQKSRAGVIITINHDGDPAYHCGLIERGAKVLPEMVNTQATARPKKKKTASLPEDLTIHRVF